METFFVGRSDVGQVRERNEDSFFLHPAHRIAVVADGMGGHLSGDLASSVAVQTIRRFYEHTVFGEGSWPLAYDKDLSREENSLVVGVRWANAQVYGQARKVASDSVMGTTVVALMFDQMADRVVIGHVGDSRCYRLRGGQLELLTTDHSLVSEVTEIAPWLTEEEIKQLPSNVITRALGMGPDVVVDLLSAATEAGDIYLLCSDGLNTMLSDDEIRDILLSEDMDIAARATALVSRANELGGTDNITVVLSAVQDAEDAEFADTLDMNEGDGPVEGGAAEFMSFDLEEEEDTARHSSRAPQDD